MTFNIIFDHFFKVYLEISEITLIECQIETMKVSSEEGRNNLNYKDKICLTKSKDIKIKIPPMN